MELTKIIKDNAYTAKKVLPWMALNRQKTSIKLFNLKRKQFYSNADLIRLVTTENSLGSFKN